MRIADLAKIANVSTATVSRVLNKQDGVAKETRERIQELIDEMNYQPNLLGRNLRRSATKLVLTILPTFSNAFYSDILAAIETKAAERGYMVMTCENNKYMMEYLNLIRTRLVDGVILFYSSMTADEVSELAKQYSVVQCCEYVENAKAPIVCIDDEAAGYDAAKHLLKYGHRKIAFIGTTAFSSMLRYKGLCRALKEESGDEKDIAYLKIEDFHLLNEGWTPAIADVLSLPSPPTAFLCCSDEYAVQAIEWLKERKYRVPEDISVMGFDDNPIVRYFHPKLTSIAQDKEELGKQAFELLYSRLSSGNGSDERIFVPHRLEERQTVAAVSR